MMLQETQTRNFDQAWCQQGRIPDLNSKNSKSSAVRFQSGAGERRWMRWLHLLHQYDYCYLLESLRAKRRTVSVIEWKMFPPNGTKILQQHSQQWPKVVSSFKEKYKSCCWREGPPVMVRSHSSTCPSARHQHRASKWSVCNWRWLGSEKKAKRSTRARAHHLEKKKTFVTTSYLV